MWRRARETFLAIQDGAAKKPSRAPKRNPSRTVTDDDIPLSHREIAKPKNSADTGHARLAIEDKVKANAAPNMSTTETVKNNQLTKTPPKAPLTAIPEHDIDLDEEKCKAYWLRRPKQYIVEQLRMRCTKLAAITLIRRDRDILTNVLLDMIA